jgi:anaerobic ribonucleoside-triphosphate reductase activating protein
VDKINKVKKLIDAIVICGGEPTLQNDLPEFAKRAKEKNLLVKLDTNGSNPEMLKNLLEKKLIDYIAMDIKGPLYLYPKIIGGEMNSKNVKESMRIITKFPDYEFRTTIVPIISKDNKTRWISPSEIKDAAELIYYCTEEKRGHKYLLQKFTACEKGEMIDENFSRKVLQSEFWETPNKIIEECVKEAKKWLPNTTAREKL